MTREELIAKLKEAKGPDRELDIEISFLMKYPIKLNIWKDGWGVNYVGKTYCSASDGGTAKGKSPRQMHKDAVDCVMGFLVRPGITNLTESIDAAVALIKRVRPDVNCIGFDERPNGATAYVSLNCVPAGVNAWMKEADGATPAIALCIALLESMSGAPPGAMSDTSPEAAMRRLGMNPDDPQN